MDERRMPGAMWAFLFWGLLVGAPLGTVLLAGAFLLQGDVARLARLPLLSPRAAAGANGPTAFQGALARGDGGRVVTPLGADVAGWSGAVRSTIRHGKTSHSQTLCVRGVLAGLTLDGIALALPPAQPIDSAWDLVSRIGPRGAAVTAGDLAESSTLPPDCTLAPLVHGETRQWVEHRFAVGAIATFIGCRDPDGLAPCASPTVANGLFVSGSRVALVRRLLAATLGAAALLALVVLAMSLVAAGYTLRALAGRAEPRS